MFSSVFACPGPGRGPAGVPEPRGHGLRLRAGHEAEQQEQEQLEEERTTRTSIVAEQCDSVWLNLSVQEGRALSRGSVSESVRWGWLGTGWGPLTPGELRLLLLLPLLHRQARADGGGEALQEPKGEGEDG